MGTVAATMISATAHTWTAGVDHFTDMVAEMETVRSYAMAETATLGVHTAHQLAQDQVVVLETQHSRVNLRLH